MLFAFRLKHKPYIQLNAFFIWGILSFYIKVENEVINGEWGGKCRCWAGNYDGKAIQQHYCRIILSSIILPFFTRNFKALWIKPIDFFGNLFHNNSCSRQHQTDLVWPLQDQRSGPDRRSNRVIKRSVYPPMHNRFMFSGSSCQVLPVKILG